MKITTARRISQVLFFIIFLWFCIVSTVGIKWWQLRGWPVDLFLYLDPLTAIATILTTHTLFKPLLWALAVIVLTIIFGRFFCGWVCPFGSIHQFTGFLNNRKKRNSDLIKQNKYRKLQVTKYYILILFLVIAILPSSVSLLQTGLLDPIPLITRSINLILLPIADSSINITSANTRLYEGAWLIFTIFLAAILLNLFIPRFFCRIICPLGALFGIISRYSIWRIGKNNSKCRNDHICEKYCEGGCDPAGEIKLSECILCFNCIGGCKDKVIRYQTKPSVSGEIVNPGISRKGFLISIGSGIFLAPAIRLSGSIDKNWFYKTIRPPGALAEDEFLKRCIKCGQCMRVCPTNVIQPGGIERGFENLWTPVLNNRIGISGCQYNCVACGQICPSSAIRPVTLDEKHGRGKYSDAGRIRIGTAFVDRNRCLPWAMNKPCIVCQENCPVSPKAIYTDEIYETIRNGIRTAINISENKIKTKEKNQYMNELTNGDYYCVINESQRVRILSYKDRILELSVKKNIAVKTNTKILIQVRLQRPYVEIEKCNGCGICEHECPVSGKRGIRVSGEGETRSGKRTLFII